MIVAVPPSFVKAAVRLCAQSGIQIHRIAVLLKISSPQLLPQHPCAGSLRELAHAVYCQSSILNAYITNWVSD